MANYARVKTKKSMSVSAIDEAICWMNLRIFSGRFGINYFNCLGDAGSWGDHIWQAYWNDDPLNNSCRTMWRNSARHFEMRHGGASELDWWWDAAVLNEIAVVFDGVIQDDGCDDIIQHYYTKCDDYELWLMHMYPGRAGAEARRMKMNQIPRSLLEK